MSEPPPTPSAVAVIHAPSDVLRLILSLTLLVVTIIVGIFFGDAVVTFAARLLAGLAALPSWMVGGVASLAQIAAVALAALGIAAAVRSRSWRLLLTAVVAIAVGAVVTTVLVHLVGAHARRVTDFTPILALGRGSTWSVGTLGGLVAGVSAIGPWVSRRWRRIAWATLVGLALTSFVTNPVSFDTLLAVLAGWASGTAVVVVAGSPSLRPTTAAIADGLRSVGVHLTCLEPASVDARGSTPYFGETSASTRLFVKALGRDERSADLLFRLYRRILPGNLGDEKPFSTLRRTVEHEALVALTARDLGVRTPRLVAFATAAPDGFVLAYEAVDGRSLDRVAPDDLTDAVLDEVWRQLARLRQHRIAHRDLRLANVFLAENGDVWLIDFGFSELAASDLLLATDIAELLASSATSVGAERSLAAGTRAIGDEANRSALDRLQLPLLSGATRTAMKEDPQRLADLRRAVADLPA